MSLVDNPQRRSGLPSVETLTDLRRGSLWTRTLTPEQLTDVQLSQEELGYLSGVSRQRVNQALRKLERAVLVKLEFGRIGILDPEGLRSFGP